MVRNAGISDDPAAPEPTEPLQIRTKGLGRKDEEGPGPEFPVLLDDVTLKAARPKVSLWVATMAVWGNKYASDGAQAGAVMDFLQAALDRPSYMHVIARIKDRDDEFDTEALGALFEGLVAEMRRLEPEVLDESAAEPTNRAQRRQVSRRG